jgi:hypothetical protein
MTCKTNLHFFSQNECLFSRLDGVIFQKKPIFLASTVRKPHLTCSTEMFNSSALSTDGSAGLRDIRHASSAI